MPQATSLSGRAPGEVVAVVVTVLRAEDSLSEQTIARLEALMGQFAAFIERGQGVRSLDGVTPEMVQGYLRAPTAEGLAPGASLQYFRRLAVRVLFRTARQLGLAVGDPSIDLALPPRGPGLFRALEEDEIELCRAVVIGSGVRPAAAWALCEATARTGELPWIGRSDLHVQDGRVWIHGTPRTAARWGQLTDWGVTQLTRRLAEIDAAPHTPIVGSGTPGSALAQSSAVGLISRTLTRAGLGDAPGVRASSVPAWAGRKIFDDTGRIDLAAARLGMQSLDRTARFIGWEWAAPDG
ncbi:MAG: hypothetical protein ACOYXM_17680 [Actinomycetota bacterium]